jgi:predicted secreted protein
MARHHAREVFSRLRDERSGKVVFTSHCLLNENTRFAGGAFRPGVVSEVLAGIVENGWGIYQMPCPEQRAWGGVLKRRLLRAYGARPTLLYRLREPVLGLFIGYTRLVYARLARRVARDIADYQRSGFDVVGIVGVGSSPTCGVTTTLDMRRSFEAVAACPLAAISRDKINECAVIRCRVAGEGLFIRSLRRQLSRRGLAIPLLEHDLVEEMHGQEARSLVAALRRS